MHTDESSPDWNQSQESNYLSPRENFQHFIIRCIKKGKASIRITVSFFFCQEDGDRSACHSVSFNQCQRRPFDRCAYKCGRKARQTRTWSGSPGLHSPLHGFLQTGGCLAHCPTRSSTCGEKRNQITDFQCNKKWRYKQCCEDWAWAWPISHALCSNFNRGKLLEIMKLMQMGWF